MFGVGRPLAQDGLQRFGAGIEFAGAGLRFGSRRGGMGHGANFHGYGCGFSKNSAFKTMRLLETDQMLGCGRD